MDWWQTECPAHKPERRKPAVSAAEGAPAGAVRSLKEESPPYPVRRSARLEGLLEEVRRRVQHAARIWCQRARRHGFADGNFLGRGYAGGFHAPGGKLYVPGAEKLIPNLKRLTDAAREGRVFIIGDACTHTPDDPEFKRFPRHCVRGTPGAEIIPETRADKVLVIPNRADAAIPRTSPNFSRSSLKTDARCVRQSQYGESARTRRGIHQRGR